MKPLSLLLIFLFIVPLLFLFIPLPTVDASAKAPSEPLIESNAKIIRTINTVPGFFNGVPTSPNITVTYGFSRLGAFWFSNPQGNFTTGIMTLKCGAQGISWPLSTGGKVYYNSTTIAYSFAPISGCTGNIQLYFKQQRGALNYPSSNMKVIITGTLSTPATLNLIFLGGSLTLATDLTGKTKYQVKMGSTGLGFDWSDAPDGTWNVSTKTLSYSVGTSFTIDPTTIGTSTTADAADYTFSRKDWFSNTRYWKWYSDGTNLGYRSSTDGTTWSSFTTITTSGAATVAFLFNTYVSGTTLYYCDGPDGGNVFYYGSYTLNSDGTITAGIAEKTITKTKTTSIRTYCSVALDSTGNLWFTAGSDDATNKFVEVWQCATPLASCTPTDKKDITVGTDAAITHPISIMLGLASGRLAVWYGDSANNVATKLITASDANTWNTAVSTTTKLAMFHTSAINSGDTIYLTGRSNVDNTILYWTCAYACGSAPTEVTVESAGDSTNAPSITISSSTLIDVYSTSTSTNYRTSTDSGSTWSGKTTIASSLTIPAGNAANSGITAMSSCNGSTCAASWVEGNASPFNVRFHTFTIQVTQPITLTVDNSGATGTFTLSGCAVSPTTHSGSGQTSYTATPSCTITITVPSDGANSRERFSGGSTTTVATCGSGTCTDPSITYYNELQNTYQATPKAQSTWDSGLTAPAVVGTVAGTGSTTGCSITLTGGGGAASCSAWFDYNRAVVIGLSTISGAPANSQWLRNGACSSTSTTGGNTLNCDFYKQWTNTFQLTAKAQTTFDSGLSAAITGNSIGASATICTVSPTSGQATGTCSGYVDNANTPSVPTTMTGAGVNTQWTCGTCTFSSISSGGVTLNVNEYKQLTNTYQAKPHNQPTWDYTYTVAISGTSLGAGATLCSITATAGTTTDSCSAYGDYNTAASLPSSFADQVTGTWTAFDARSFTDTTGGNIHTTNYDLTGGSSPNPSPSGSSGTPGGGGGGPILVLPPPVNITAPSPEVVAANQSTTNLGILLIIAIVSSGVLLGALRENKSDFRPPKVSGGNPFRSVGGGGGNPFVQPRRRRSSFARPSGSRANWRRPKR